MDGCATFGDGTSHTASVAANEASERADSANANLGIARSGNSRIPSSLYCKDILIITASITRNEFYFSAANEKTDSFLAE
mmetsp:Transcript_6466/g.18514  ORF Transcript_6466/g.18514 Transcript_6466/m.18514 type:complete len:80 (+) Transcript_6466:10082-10321(+)